jgi:hypothetical protein
VAEQEERAGQDFNAELHLELKEVYATQNEL